MTTGAKTAEARHPIGVVSERTGLSPDVLRVWERRYGAVEPSRSADGQREYTDRDVERLRLLRLATLVGRNIGHVAGLSTEELTRLVRDDEDAARQRVDRPEATVGPGAAEVNRAMELARTVDAPGLESFLRRTAAAHGVPAFLDRLAAPLLDQMGDEWEAGRLTPGQEHLATEIVERVLEGLIHFLVAAPGAPSLLLATPPGEDHKIGTVLAAAAAAAEGWRVTYLGPDLRADEIETAARAAAAQVVCVSVVHLDERDHVLEELRALRSRLAPSVPLLAGGTGAVALAADLQGSGIQVVADLSELRAALRASLARSPFELRLRV